MLNANLFELTKNYWELFKSNYKTKYLSISELANKVVTGKTPSKKKKEYYENGNVPFIKIPDMHGRVFVTDSTEHLSTVGANSQKSKFIPKGSIIVSCIGRSSPKCWCKLNSVNLSFHKLKHTGFF